ncbi:16S rRNA (guanine966-N2)-methyltransferase [Halanaerobium sp. DL-01]|uniref:16S rRNA (guanine(966)-N(2))-methyltransferase RsmD n=1 Tax=Halanaerobium sp. DL-01 TaxID=1653064 RepID=UPI000DF26FC4|nr:16S rRNA (guanine(966)-N(2))-methyltransferase RsmD [Halanaerobium sp. DL-01]RCW89216.1 16S rRNA (guanine966-N2)-methyltransferase [Halanaerobium sp. DL-01]
MRIIAGSAGGIKLKSIKSRQVRPTLDRVKEALFNMLGQSILDSVFLDLYAGFGGIGIEALSRGAKKVDFVEKNRKFASIIKRNLNKTNLINFGEIYCEDVYNFLQKTSTQYDIIFMDPPYKKGYVKKTINIILENRILNSRGLIVIETASDEKIDLGKKFQMIRERKYGGSQIYIYKLSL